LAKTNNFGTSIVLYMYICTYFKCGSRSKSSRGNGK